MMNEKGTEMAVNPNALHVIPMVIDGHKVYQVKAIGQYWIDGFRVGERLTEPHLADIQEIGGEIKYVKASRAEIERDAKAAAEAWMNIGKSSD